MKTFALLTTVFALAVASPALAQQPAPPVKAVQPDSVTVTAYYKQSVYDKSDSKIGQIADVLVGQDGKITGLVVGAGGFLGMGRHDVIVPFSAVKMTKKADNADKDRARRNMVRNDNYLVMDTTKDALKDSPAVSYDRTAMTWVPDTGNKASASDEPKRNRRRN